MQIHVHNENTAHRVELIPVYVASLQMTVSFTKHSVSMAPMKHPVVVHAHNVSCNIILIFNYCNTS